MNVDRMNHSRTYRSRFDLIHENAQNIYRGPLHIVGGQKWEFVVTIPSHVDSSSLACRDPGKDKLMSYLPLDAQNVATHPLPPSFSFKHQGGSTEMEAFVEYYLQAHLSFMKSSETELCEAVLPVRVLNPEPNIVGYHFKRWTQSRCIYSYHLLPGMERSSLSFSQKTRNLFGTSSVPTFKFELQVDFPTVVQLDGPNPLSFKIRAVPDWQGSSKDLCKHHPFVRLTCLRVLIEHHTEIMCEGTIHPHVKSTKQTVDLRMNNALSTQSPPVYIPCTDQWPALDVGKIVNLRAGSDYPSPCFTTYNIKRRDVLNWEIDIEVVGETIKKITGDDVTQDYRVIQVLQPLGTGNVSSRDHQAESSSRLVTGSSSQGLVEDELPPTFEQARYDISLDRGASVR